MAYNKSYKRVSKSPKKKGAKGQTYGQKTMAKIAKGGKRKKMSYSHGGVGGKAPYHLTKQNRNNKGASGGNARYVLTKKSLKKA